MNRKNTILIAVLINAGLLSVLLIAALTTQEETVPASTIIGDAAPNLLKIEDQPLFGDAADLGLRQTALQSPQQVYQQAGELAAVMPEPSKSSDVALAPQPVQEPLVHKLPPLTQEQAPVSPVSAALVAAAAPQNASGKTHLEVKVKKGDTLEKIAKAHQTTVDEILKLNRLPSSFLKIGQVLKVPAEKTLTTSKPAVPEKKPAETGPEYYTVKVGDNPWTIAMKHHIKVEELLRLNSLNEERARKLKPGDRLRTR